MPNKQSYMPLRQCAGCGERHPKQELIRITAADDGTLAADAAGRSPGRGVYVCRNRACIEKAFRKRSFSKLLPGASGLDELRMQLERMTENAE